MSQTLTPSARPFVIEHHQTTEPAGHFIPSARLAITPALRTGGLVAALSDEQARTLLALLTFLTANGEVQATAGEVADAMALSHSQARRRLDRLAALLPHGNALVHTRTRDAGLPVYALSSEQYENEHITAPLNAPAPPSTPWANRAAVIAHSRAMYGVPRREAEQVVAEQLGHAVEEREDTPQGEARRRLLSLGVDRQEIEELIASFAVEEVRQQLDWLPECHPRNPARLIVAAIRGNYEAPLSWRRDDADSGEVEVSQTEAEQAPSAGEVVSLEIPDGTEGGTHGE